MKSKSVRQTSKSDSPRQIHNGGDRPLAIDELEDVVLLWVQDDFGARGIARLVGTTAIKAPEGILERALPRRRPRLL